MTTSLDLMETMLAKAKEEMKNNISGYGFNHKIVCSYKITVCCSNINTNSKTNQFFKYWRVDDKRISAAKVKTILDSLNHK